MRFLPCPFVLILAPPLLAACGDDEPAGPRVQDDGQDLTIRFIERLPRMDYVWRSRDPAREGGPT